MSFTKSKIKHIHKLLAEKKISCKELTARYLDEIQKHNKDLNSFINITDTLALTTAEKVDKKIKEGTALSPLEGIPMSLKDNISTQEIKTTCCSNVLKEYVPPYDATCWELLKAQNAVLLGKTNMDEFAMGCSCETSCFDKCNNPYNTSYVPGGSSGGSAASVCANLSVFSLGSDTGGSIRQPASFCGIVGLKPTYGAISRYGLLALASSLDQIGPLASCVEDISLVYDFLSVKDKKDSTCFGNVNGPTFNCLNDSIKGMRIGLPKQYLEDNEESILKYTMSAAKIYESIGATIVPMDIPDIKYSLPIYYILMCSEAASNLARFDGIRYGFRTKSYSNIEEMFFKTRGESFGEDVKRRILLGNYVLSGENYKNYYEKALRIRQDIINTFDEAFTKCDVILSPTVPQNAFLHDFKPDDQMEAYMSDISTVPVNISGTCAISIPCGFDSNGLPIGLQLIGNRFCESTIFNAAFKLEHELGFCSGIDTGVIL